METIHFKDNKWWWWDEIEVQEFGPYDSKEEAEQDLQKYLVTLNREEDNACHNSTH